MITVLKQFIGSLLLALVLMACSQPEGYVGTWRTDFNGVEVITIIKADGSVIHRRGEKEFHSTWQVNEQGQLLMDGGHVVGRLEKGQLIVSENNQEAALERVAKP